MSITGAIFRPSGELRIIVQTTAANLNSRLRPGETWREVPAGCLNPGEAVPALASLPPHPDLVEPV